MTTLTLSAKTVSRTHNDQAIAKIGFVRHPVIIDRDFDIARQVKLLGMSAATAVTLITAAVFLFM